MDFKGRLAAVLGSLAVLVVVTMALAGGASAARHEDTQEYLRALQTVADLQAYPPAVPLVCMLGGSSARASTISDLAWTRQIRSDAGCRLVAFNLGSRNRLLTTDRRLVGMFPDVHPLVYIGVNMGRFCRGHTDPAITLPGSSGSTPSPQSRAPGPTHALSDAVKRSMVTQWQQERWPQFQRNHRYELGVLESAVRLSLERGQHPVIIDLPRNMAIIGHQLDRPLALYHAGCRAIAKRNGIPYVEFQSQVAVGNRDFRDLWHLLPQSRHKWQRQLSLVTAKLLGQYGLRPGPAPSQSPSAPAAPAPEL
jgi:hypothetical protein